VVVLRPCSLWENREESESAVGQAWRNREPGGRSVFVAVVSTGVVMGKGDSQGRDRMGVPGRSWGDRMLLLIYTPVFAD